MKSTTEPIVMVETEDVRERNGASGVKLTDLLTLVPLQSVRGPRDVPVRRVTMDSREVRPGDLFVAVQGDKVDGHRFLDDVVERGAVAIVSERAPESRGVTWVQTPDARKAAGVMAARALGEPARRMGLVGITGTNGKTTSAFLVSGVLSRLAPPSAMLGTVVARIGEKSSPAKLTTPEAPVLQEFLADAVAAGCRFGALEVSSHGLALSRLEGAEFEVALFTNLSRDHLDFHRDMEDYFRAKRLLFTRYLRPKGRAVVCIDDSYGERLASELSVETVTYGFSATADLAVVEVEASLDGTRLTFRDGAERNHVRTIESPVLGRYNAVNLLGVFAAVRALGFDAERVLEVLATTPGAPGRFERVALDRSFDVVVDYAHTDDALRKLLQAVRPLTRGKLWVVFGCGGERDRTKRPLMGDVAARLADRIVLTSDNPRGEDPEAILREIQLGTKGATKPIEAQADRRKAIALALEGAGPGDVVVVAGKGHEPYQIVGDRVLDFDDRLVVREILRSSEGETGEGRERKEST